MLEIEFGIAVAGLSGRIGKGGEEAAELVAAEGHAGLGVILNHGVLQPQGVVRQEAHHVDAHLALQRTAGEVGVGERYLAEGTYVGLHAVELQADVLPADGEEGVGVVGLAVEVSHLDEDGELEGGAAREVDAAVGLGSEGDVEGAIGGGGGAVVGHLDGCEPFPTPIALADNMVFHLGAGEGGTAVGRGAAADGDGTAEGGSLVGGGKRRVVQADHELRLLVFLHAERHVLTDAVALHPHRPLSGQTVDGQDVGGGGHAVGVGRHLQIGALLAVGIIDLE